jgi:hypothetical protein
VIGPAEAALMKLVPASMHGLLPLVCSIFHEYEEELRQKLKGVLLAKKRAEAAVEAQKTLAALVGSPGKVAADVDAVAAAAAAMEEEAAAEAEEEEELARTMLTDDLKDIVDDDNAGGGAVEGRRWSACLQVLKAVLQGFVRYVGPSVIVLHLKTGSSMKHAPTCSPESWQLISSVSNFLEEAAAEQIQSNSSKSAAFNGGGESSQLKEALKHRPSTPLLLSKHKHQPPLVVCVVTRPLLQERMTPQFEEILRNASDTDTQLHLRPLGERDRRLHLCHTLGVPEVPDLVADLVSDLSAGNPQHIELTANTLVEQELCAVGEENGEKMLKVIVSEQELRRISVPSKMVGGVMGLYEHLRRTHQEVRSPVHAHAFSYIPLPPIPPPTSHSFTHTPLHPKVVRTAALLEENFSCALLLLCLNAPSDPLDMTVGTMHTRIEPCILVSKHAYSFR